MGDTKHHVGTVSDGVRVTLAYELYRDGKPDPFADALLQRAEAVRQAFAAVVADEACLPEGGTLGFEAAHLYEEKELSATDKAPAGGVGPHAWVTEVSSRVSP